MAGDEAHPGVMPLAITDLFALSAEEDDFTWRFSMVYIEIYNERVKDLLAPETGHDLDVREDARRGTHIQGALEVSVGSLHELLEYMDYMEGLAEGLPRLLYVHGSGQEIINFEQSMNN